MNIWDISIDGPEAYVPENSKEDYKARKFSL